LLLAPPPPRLGRIAQRIDQFRGFAGHTLLPQAHLLDLPLEIAERVAPLRLDLGDAFLIALQALVDRLQ
jgi:hypothetical protein